MTNIPLQYSFGAGAAVSIALMYHGMFENGPSSRIEVLTTKWLSKILIVFGILAAIFVGINIGGSSTGVAFGPSVGSKLVSKTWSRSFNDGFCICRRMDRR